jgi:threonine dehydrogenase-like Zn-dependent dehydrogenase
LSQNLLQEVQKITDNNGADVVIEAVGNPITYKAAIDVVAFVGRVACIGYAKDDVSFTTKYFVQKELDIMGSRNATAVDFRAVVSYLQNHRDFPLGSVVTQKIPLVDSPDAIANWSKDPSQVTKILVDVER